LVDVSIIIFETIINYVVVLSRNGFAVLSGGFVSISILEINRLFGEEITIQVFSLTRESSVPISIIGVRVTALIFSGSSFGKVKIIKVSIFISIHTSGFNAIGSWFYSIIITISSEVRHIRRATHFI
jgi:hypothetical protein